MRISRRHLATDLALSIALESLSQESTQLPTSPDLPWKQS